MRIENQRMKDFLSEHGINAKPKYIWRGSMKRTWRIYAPGIRWTDEIRQKFTNLGFFGFDGKPLHQFSGNGGALQVFVCGHYEFLEGITDRGCV